MTQHTTTNDAPARAKLLWLVPAAPAGEPQDLTSRIAYQVGEKGMKAVLTGVDAIDRVRPGTADQVYGKIAGAVILQTAIAGAIAPIPASAEAGDQDTRPIKLPVNRNEPGRGIPYLFDPMPDWLLPALKRADLTGTEFKMLLHIAENTYGDEYRHEGRGWFTMRGIAEAIGTSRANVSKYLDRLIEQRVLVVEEGDSAGRYLIAWNDQPATWKCWKDEPLKTNGRHILQPANMTPTEYSTCTLQSTEGDSYRVQHLYSTEYSSNPLRESGQSQDQSKKSKQERLPKTQETYPQFEQKTPKQVVAESGVAATRPNNRNEDMSTDVYSYLVSDTGLSEQAGWLGARYNNAVTGGCLSAAKAVVEFARNESKENPIGWVTHVLRQGTTNKKLDQAITRGRAGCTCTTCTRPKKMPAWVTQYGLSVSSE